MTLWQYLLPLGPGDRLLGVRLPPTVAASLAAEGATLLSVGQAGGSTLDSAVEHALVLGDSSRGAVLAAARGVRPGGTVVVAIPSRLVGTRARVRRTSRRMKAAGVEVTHALWLSRSWTDPHGAVPLDSPSALHWFARRLYVPWSRTEAMRVAVAATMPLTAPLLMPGVAVVGRRREQGAGRS